MAEASREVNLELPPDVAWALVRRAGAEIDGYRETNADGEARRVKWRHRGVSVVAEVGGSETGSQVSLHAEEGGTEQTALVDLALDRFVLGVQRLEEVEVAAADEARKARRQADFRRRVVTGVFTGLAVAMLLWGLRVALIMLARGG